MKILAIETSGSTASVALVEQRRRGRRSGIPARPREPAERVFPSKMTLNQTLTAHMRDVCGGEPLAEMGLDGIAVGIGPGSFTGVRMGVAVAKAIAHALELPLMGVSAPQAMAAAVPAGCVGRASSLTYRICVMQKARANEVYVTALLRQQGSLATEAGPTEVLTIHEALRMAEKRLGGSPDLFCGDGTREHSLTIQAAFGYARLADERYDTPRAAVMADIGAALLEQADPAAAFSLRPRYVRLSQAERERSVDLDLK